MSATAEGISIDYQGVRMESRVETRLRHVSDTVGGMGVAYGGDTMGHWNVDRIHRILDACSAPVIQLPLSRESMIGLARAGAPDMSVVRRYVEMGAISMPPLTFVALADRQPCGGIRTLLVDGHHRMMALALLDQATAPTRILPPELADDVRIVEMQQAAVFPEPQFPTREVEIPKPVHMAEASA